MGGQQQPMSTRSQTSFYEQPSTPGSPNPGGHTPRYPYVSPSFILTRIFLTGGTCRTDAGPTGFYSTPDLRYAYVIFKIMRKHLLNIYIDSLMYRVTSHHILPLRMHSIPQLLHMYTLKLCNIPLLKPRERASDMVMD